ncbi:hypothetical protein MBLNU457_1800t1 [Dothideomycetes sp. NU457]
MSRYDYKVALNVLSEQNKNRLLACYLSTENPGSTTDWDHATASFGAASPESMRVMVRNALKKIKEAGGEGGALAAPNKSTPKSAKGRKRKTDDDNDAAEAGADASPSKKVTKKPRGRPKKADEGSDADDQIKREVEEAAGN